MARASHRGIHLPLRTRPGPAFTHSDVPSEGTAVPTQALWANRACRQGGLHAHPLRRPNSRSWPGNRDGAIFEARQASRRLRHAVAAGEHEGAGAAHHREHFVDAEVRPLWGLRRTSSTAGLVKSSRQRQTPQPECAPERILDQFRPQFCTQATPGDDVSRETRRGHERSGQDVEFMTGSGAARGCASSRPHVIDLESTGRPAAATRGDARTTRAHGCQRSTTGAPQTLNRLAFTAGRAGRCESTDLVKSSPATAG